MKKFFFFQTKMAQECNKAFLSFSGGHKNIGSSRGTLLFAPKIRKINNKWNIFFDVEYGLYFVNDSFYPHLLKGSEFRQSIKMQALNSSLRKGYHEWGKSTNKNASHGRSFYIVRRMWLLVIFLD